MRELADHLSTPIFVVDPAGDLLFYNEPAERLLGSRFDETGMMPFAEWSTTFTPTDAEDHPIPADELPLAIAVQSRRPAQGGMWIRAHDGERRQLTVDRDPTPRPVGRVSRRGRDLLGNHMKVTIWGTRGSQASPGPDTIRYGGNTACVEVEAQPDARIVLDAGTGLRLVGNRLPPAVRRVDVLLTHLHMDHIQGLGFFAPLFRPEFEVHIWGPGSANASLRERLTRYMSPPLFPVRLPELPCELHVHDLDEEAVEVPGATVRSALVCHPGPTVGYRLEGARGSLAYLSDHEPFLACRAFAESPDWCSGFDIADRVDVLLHDAQYTEAEYEQRVGWGHSTLAHAFAFARLARVRHLIAFHFDPAHDDETLDEFFALSPRSPGDAFTFEPAREGMSFDVADARP